MTHRRLPSLNWLRVFEMAARTESFARAAEALNMSPPAVSQQIRALEAWLGRDLFERQARAVRLTDAGRAFLPAVGNAIGSVEATAASLFGRAGAEPLVVRSTALLTVGWLGPRMGRFLAAHPHVQVTLLSALSDTEFARSDADVQITFGLPPSKGQTGRRLFGERLYPVAAPGLSARISAPSDLLGHPLIEVMAHDATWFRMLPERDAWPAEPRFIYCDTTLTALAMAASGAGVALARAPATDTVVAQLGLVPCLPDTAVDGLESYHLRQPATPLPGPAARAFADWLLAEATGKQAY